jgi:hypothetical protein
MEKINMKLINKNKIKDFVIKLPKYVRKFAFDVGYYGKAKSGKWIPNNFSIVDVDSGQYVRQIYLPSTSSEFDHHHESLSWMRVHQILSKILRNVVLIGFNADNDLDFFPMPLKYCLGVHDVQQRYYRKLGIPNPYFGDNNFGTLKAAIEEIGESEYLAKQNTPILDAQMTAALWRYCDMLDFEEDPKINYEILKKYMELDDRQSTIELDNTDKAHNNHLSNELSYRREQFKKCNIDYGNTDTDPITLEYGNKYDKDNNRVINTFGTPILEKIVFE